jgi:hypothetical protein
VNSPQGLIALFGFTIFLSAFLLFQVQLIIAKYILPWFGGTPATFTTCILFFQTLLLLGYLYAHFIDTRLSSRGQAMVHSALIALAVAVLVWRVSTWGSPLLPDASWKPPDSEHPLLRILALLSASVALPYFLVSTTGPLLQAWYSRICRGTPYRLYALSNAGSLLALLSYPVMVEPFLKLRIQAHAWASGFYVFGTCCIAIAWRAARQGTAEVEPFGRPGNQPGAVSIGWRRKLLWLALAGAGSLSLLATTNRICQDVAVVPLLWVLPLSLYLLSFIACFSSEQWYSRGFWSIGMAVATLLVCFVLYHPNISTLLQILVYSYALLASCMVCHGELVGLKPPKEYLTSFYLYVAAGGALGGFFVSIVAPLIFKGFWEFHLSVWLCCMLFCFVLLQDRASWIYRPKPILLAFAVLLIAVGPALAGMGWRPIHLAILMVLVGGLILFMWSGTSAAASVRQQRHAAVFSICFVAILLAGVIAYPPFAMDRRAIVSARNFYGVETVISDSFEGSARRVLRHGKILHGFQFSDASKKRLPTSYFTAKSGIGLVLTNYPGRAGGKPLRIGVIGLGVGTLAAYGVPGDEMRFYEINPDVIGMATRGPRETFTFISDSPAHIQIVAGDARISMERELRQDQAQHFDVLVIDAFSGDSIPLHLLTKEAFQLYRQHLAKPNGILAFHISNNAIDLRPVIERLAAENNMSAWWAESDPPYTSIWVIVGQRDRDAPMPGIQSMKPIASNPNFPLWTDDYSNLLQILRWR